MIIVVTHGFTANARIISKICRFFKLKNMDQLAQQLIFLTSVVKDMTANFTPSLNVR